jgi:hypothetical protein
MVWSEFLPAQTLRKITQVITLSILSVTGQFATDQAHVVCCKKLKYCKTTRKLGSRMRDAEIAGWVLEEFVSPTATLTQGDLIKFEDVSDPLRRVGIVVTADCDLEQKKHARLVTMIPVVSITVLLENYLLVEDCEKKRQQIEGYALKMFEIDRTQEAELRNAVLREKLSTKSDSSESHVIAGKFVTDQLESISIKDYSALMSAIQSGIKKPESLSQQILSRGDILILPSLEKFNLNDDIAWVRHIWQVPVSDIALRTSEISSRPGERVARLDSPFRYRLTQLLAQVFSDIGLPNIPNSVEQRIKEAFGHD